MKRLAVAVSLIICSCAIATPALGAEAKQAFNTEYGKTLPPIGFVRFCMQNPNDCITKPVANRHLKLTDQTWQELVSVNTEVNGAITPVSDQDLYGIPELWTYPVDSGDCEDFLLLKKRNLERLGFDPNTLLITVVLDEKNEGHAVLTATTEKGDFVLDNRRNEILLWNETGYKFLKRQSQTNAQQWVALARQKTDNADQVSSGE